MTRNRQREANECGYAGIYGKNRQETACAVSCNLLKGVYDTIPHYGYHKLLDQGLYYALRMHSIGNLLKCGDVRAHYIVAFMAVFFRGSADLRVDIHHDLLQTGICFLE